MRWQIHSGLDTTPTPLPNDRLAFLEMKESMLMSELEQMRAGVKPEGEQILEKLKTATSSLVPLSSADVVVDGEVQFSEAREETWKSIREVEASVERTRTAITESKGAVEKCSSLLLFRPSSLWVGSDTQRPPSAGRSPFCKRESSSGTP